MRIPIPQEERGQWWKQRYFVDQGHIAPIRGTLGEWYDPMASYLQRETWGEHPPIHLALASLDTDSEERVEKFCSTWGLLGLFQHSLLQVTYVPGARGGAKPRHQPPHTYAEVIETRWGRTVKPAQSAEDREQFVARSLFSKAGIPLDSEAELARRFVAAEIAEWWKDTSSGGEAIVLQDGVPVSMSLTDWFGKYFRELDFYQIEIGLGGQHSDIDLLAEYPTWTSRWLWDVLSEPLSEFRSAVAEFKETFQLCTRLEHALEGKAELFRLIEGRINRHLTFVTSSVQFDASSGLTPSTEGWRQEWRYPSLLAAGYLSLNLSLTRGARFRFCSNRRCGKPFEAERADQLFCSRACQKAEKQRRLRERKS